MKRLGVFLAVLSLVLALVPAAMGDFSTPPETNAAIEWETAPPYQRNMTLDFSTDPVNPTGGTGAIPGAKYEGFDDPYLWDSDYVKLEGLTWNEDLGGVGIFGGEQGDAGSIIIHFDNWERDWQVKHLYTEFTFVQESPWVGVAVDVIAPAGYLLSPEWVKWPDLSTVQYYRSIWPNPPWEDLVITLELYEPGSIYITDLQLATECVPVPGATLLALLGLGAAGAKLRRFV